MQVIPPSPETENALMELGRKQIEALFAFNASIILDDSEFIPLMDAMIEVFMRAGLSPQHVSDLRAYVIECYHHLCQSVVLEMPPNKRDTKHTYADDVELMMSFLPSSRRKVWKKSAK